MSAYDLEAAHKHCGQHRAEIESSRLCGCFHCLATFAPEEIVEWCDEGEVTAICPRCDIDAVLGDASSYGIDAEFLDAMHEHWFEQTIGPGDPRWDELVGGSFTPRERVGFFFDRFRRD